VQQPRVPIWVVGAWPRPKSMRRVLKCDGILPVVSMPGRDSPLSPEDVRELAAWLADRGASSTSPTQPSPDSRPRRTYSELP
jgi:hypothetical protein